MFESPYSRDVHHYCLHAANRSVRSLPLPLPSHWSCNSSVNHSLVDAAQAILDMGWQNATVYKDVAANLGADWLPPINATLLPPYMGKIEMKLMGTYLKRDGVF
jgi:hypothetical protein